MTEPSVDPPTIGPFDVLYKLGEGAMGVVYAGRDRQLDRKVALKLVRRQLLENAAVRTRMVREAQAMARLSSPYVVQVYQVGEHQDGIYVAMEYVDGETLSEWLKSGSRSWQVVLRTLCDAGRGLAAAHAAGLVHRDFKPDNVLVDADGRARVLDFGLVHREGGPSDEDLATAPIPLSSLPNGDNVERTDLHWSVRLTRFGNVLGTPAYMSPEQHFGRQAGAASDQFSFCITLYEALWGARPFVGDTWAAIRKQVQEETVPPPPLESRVPRRLFKVIARGLAKAPEERWPSMDALLDALERDPWRTRTRVAAMIGLIGAASSASYAVAISQNVGRTCEAQPELLAGAWDSVREAAVSRAFAATHAPFATDTWNRVRPRIDGYAQAWVGEWQAACEARAHGVQIGRLAELRSACLAHRRARLATLVEVFAGADRAVVENAVQAVAALPSVAACADEAALDLAAAPPDDPALAEKVEALRETLARAEALEGTGQYEQGMRLTSSLRAEAMATGYLPLVAEATLVDARMLMHLSRAEESAAALMDAVRIGVTQDHHLVAAEAAATRIYVLGELLGRRAEALATEGYADALVQRARDDGELVALLLNNIAVVHQNDGTFEAAASYYERALEVLRKRPGHPDILTAIIFNNLGNMAIEQGQFAAAKTRHAQAVELFGKLLGENHPLVSHPLSSLGDVSVRTGDLAGASAHYLRSLAIMEVSYGPEHPYLMHVLPGLGQAEALAGRAEAARKYFARAVGLAEAQGIRSAQLAQALEGLGDLAAATAAKEQARDLYGRAAALFDESVGKDSAKGARAALRAGELAADLGDRAAALAWYERVLAKKPGPGGQDQSRSGAALRLAAALVEGGDARACALASEARSGLVEGDPRRAEAEALAATACPKG